MTHGWGQFGRETLTRGIWIQREEDRKDGRGERDRERGRDVEEAEMQAERGNTVTEMRKVKVMSDGNTGREKDKARG
jgi:hypothetical protein